MPTDTTTRTALRGMAAEDEASYDPDRTGTPQNAPAGAVTSAAGFRTAGHEAPTAPATATGGHRPAAGAVGVESPLGLPAALRELLGIAADVDRGIARMIGLLIGLQTSGQVEANTGLPVDHFLAQLGRVTRIDRTFLTTAADVLATDDRDDPEELLEPDQRPADVLVLQPRLDGTGGKLYGDYHPLAALAFVPGVLALSQARSLRCSGNGPWGVRDHRIGVDPADGPA